MANKPKIEKEKRKKRTHVEKGEKREKAATTLSEKKEEATGQRLDTRNPVHDTTNLVVKTRKGY